MPGPSTEFGAMGLQHHGTVVVPLAYWYASAK
jgi:hypothetical protein